MDASVTNGTRTSKRKATSEGISLLGGGIAGEDEMAFEGKQSSHPTRLVESFDDQVERDVESKSISHVCKMVLRHIVDMEHGDQGIPIVLRARNLEASLGLPRRRIYDVFHIIQAIGLLNRGSEGFRSLRGHHYCGENQVIQTLCNLRASVMCLKKAERRSKATNMTSLSASAVLTGNVDEHQTPSNTKIPALWQVTHKLLRCIFARGNSISLREIYTLDDDKDGSSSKSRRYYDVLAVLTTCNILQLNTTSKFDRAKYAKLNPLILTDPQSFSVFDQVRRHDNSMPVAPVFIQRQSKLKVISSDKRPRLWAKQKATGSQQQLIAHAESNTPCEDYPSAGNTISFATLLEKSLFDIEPFEPFCHAAATDASDDHSISIANKTDFKLLLSPCKGMYESDEFESFFSQFPLTDCDSLEVDDVGDMEL